MEPEKIRVAELFAGVGGFRLGLERASDRFTVVFANQWEPFSEQQFAFRCYESHFGKSQFHVCADIRLAKREIPDHDLLVAGFPCQDYSIAKKNASGITGAKGKLWWEIVDVIKQKKPNYILLENVDRLLRSPATQKGRDFTMMLRSLYENGYAAEWRVINAADYGQPQRRKRLFLYAFRNITEYFKEIADIACTQGSYGFHKIVITDGLFANGFPVKMQVGARMGMFIDELEYGNMHDLSVEASSCFHHAGVMMNGMVYSEEVEPACPKGVPLNEVVVRDVVDEHYFIRPENIDRWRYLKGAKREMRIRKDGTKYIFSEGAVAFPDSLSRPGRTMLTGEGMMSRSSHVITDVKTGRLRILVPEECETLNGFPIGWTDTGMPEKWRYFCMGNSLVVPLVTVMGQQMVGLI